MAKKIEETVCYSGGIESKLSGFATFFLMVGIISLAACLIISGGVTKTDSYSNWGEDGVSITWIVIGIFSFLWGLISAILFQAGGEVIRLLKKLNDLPFGGKISENIQEVEIKCSNCGTLVDEDDNECYNCSQKFENKY
ncbi:MAG: hypothetical protein KGY74_04585 [Candidatus Cloacimonetes bacterium]|nr:hypothetical protein [Candidatus Cloacimonadota bacterium]